jgi:hypothetical protein
VGANEKPDGELEPHRRIWYALLTCSKWDGFVMVRFIVAALLIVLGTVGGYVYAQNGKQRSELEFPLADGMPSSYETFDYGCKGIVNATAQETVYPKNARALSGVSDDNASFHITPGKKEISVCSLMMLQTALQKDRHYE